MLLVSWNVNGLRAVLKKDFTSFLSKVSPDQITLQEIKIQENQLPPELETDPVLKSYKKFWYPAEKKGYAGTAAFTRQEPLSVIYGMNRKEFDCEGRTLTLEFKDYYLLAIYFPNAQPELARLEYKLGFNKALLAFAKKLSDKKPVLLSGDFNVAHEEIDLARPRENVLNPGFSIQERESFAKFLEPKGGFADVFREQHPDEKGHYTWWTYRANARENNVGWRIDYFLVTQDFRSRVKESLIYKDITGSDHCPVGIQIK